MQNAVLIARLIREIENAQAYASGFGIARSEFDKSYRAEIDRHRKLPTRSPTPMEWARRLVKHRFPDSFCTIGKLSGDELRAQLNQEAE